MVGMVLLQFAVPRKNTNITKHGECVPKNFGKPMTLQHSWWIPPPPFLIYAQFWWLLVVFSHTHSQYISKVWQYDLSMVKWRKKMLLWFTSRWTSKIKLIQRGRPMLWCHPKIKRLSTPIIKPPSGVHLTVLGLQVVATTFEGSAQGFQTHLLWRFQRPLIVQTSDANFESHISHFSPKVIF